MEATAAIDAFNALAQPTRLRAFRRLMRAFPGELSAGAISRFCKVPHNTMSTHLAILLRAGLIEVRRDGRVLNYRADIEGFRKVVRFLMRDCCNGHEELCAPLVAELASCVGSKEMEHVGSSV
jgi:DNA-binding transcriptional ArsR family regulator